MNYPSQDKDSQPVGLKAAPRCVRKLSRQIISEPPSKSKVPSVWTRTYSSLPMSTRAFNPLMKHPLDSQPRYLATSQTRSEERRVGKEWNDRGAGNQRSKKQIREQE